MREIALGEVINNPEWLPHTYNLDGTTLTFVEVPRAARSELRFLFDEHFRDQYTKTNVAFQAVSDAVDAAPRAPIQLIFHTSFCGSSLLARALEIPGTASSMREPAILINLANRLIKSDDQANAERLEVALRLLERPFAAGESVVSKQSNFANRVIYPILRARPDSRAVLLHSDLETYLISLLKRGMWGRILGRKLFTNMISWSKLELGMSEDEILELTDMQVAALAFLMQIHHFHSLVKTFGPRVMMLDSSALFGSPAATLDRVMTFFDLGLTGQDATDIANGPIFAKHSKFADRDYSVEERRRDTASVGEANAEELAMVTKWIAAVAGHHGVSLPPRAMSTS